MCRKLDNLVPLVAIVGRSGSGKTTLIEKLLPELRSRGHRVGTIKHHLHPFEIDYEGKDSWRHMRAGAESVAVVSPYKIACVKKTSSEMALEEIRQRFFQDVDLILAEGYKTHSQPKIEVFRAAVHLSPLASNDKHIIALISDCHLDLDIPCFDLEDTIGITDFLEERILQK